MTNNLILAIRMDGEIVGAVDADNYTGAECNYPNGWAELSGTFDQVDLQCISAEQKAAILNRYKLT